MATSSPARPSDEPHEQAAPEKAPPPKPISEVLRTWLSHPLLLLLIGSIITGILVPSFTQRWQRNQTAQAMKTEVIGDVTSAVSVPMTQLSVTQNPVFATSPNGDPTSSASIQSTFATFLSQSDTVDSTIKAYFPENTIPKHWEDLSSLLQNFYLLTYATDPRLRGLYTQSIKQYFTVHQQANGVNWQLLATGHWGVPGYYNTWAHVKGLILGVKSIVLTEVMNAPPPSF
jgi:hypothetical protein